jgi:LysM repeat protein
MRRPSVSELTLLLPLVMLLTGVVIAFAQDSSTGGSYTVQEGDVLDLIAARFDVDLACLIEANALATPARIFAGDVLAIPGSCPGYAGQSTYVAPISADDDSAADQGGGDDLGVVRQPSGSDQVYTVQRGDNYDTLGQEFNVSAQSIIDANPGLSPPELQVGQQIIIPGGAPPYGGFRVLGAGQGGGGSVQGPTAGERAYVVQPRDVLDLIAASLNVDLQCLIERNELSFPPLIYAGQVIVIPNNCADYTGDSYAVTLRAPVYSAADLPLTSGGIQPATTGGQPAIQRSPTPAAEVMDDTTGASPTATPTATPITGSGQTAPTAESFLTPTLTGQGGGAAPAETPEVEDASMEVETSAEALTTAQPATVIEDN